MTLVVCPLRNLKQQIELAQPARIVSLLGPEQPLPPVPAHIPRLSLAFHDVDAAYPGLTPPDRATVDAILRFGADWTEPGPLLIHCWMGISRSTAAATILACALDPTRDERAIARELRAASRTATPNPLMIRLADEALGRDGRLVEAVKAIGRGAETSAGAPFRLRARSGVPA